MGKPYSLEEEMKKMFITQRLITQYGANNVFLSSSGCSYKKMRLGAQKHRLAQTLKNSLQMWQCGNLAVIM